MSWTIILYESKGGQKPIEDFVKSLQENTQAKLIRQMDLLEEFGPNLGMPNAKPIGEGLFELRVRGKQEARMLYAFVVGRKIYLLHGFIKKTQAISRRDMALAISRKKEVEKI